MVRQTAFTYTGQQPLPSGKSVFGFDAIGGLIAGVLAASFGASRTLLVEGGVLLLFVLFLQARQARLRERIVQAGPPLPAEST